MNPKRIGGLLILGAALLLATSGLKGCPVTPPVVDPIVTVPFKTDKLAVLIIEETAERGRLKQGHLAAIMSTAPGSVIATVTARGGEYRILDKDQTNFANDRPWVKDAFAVPHPELPWIVAAGPKSGFSQKLPDTVAETLKLLEGVK